MGDHVDYGYERHNDSPVIQIEENRFRFKIHLILLLVIAFLIASIGILFLFEVTFDSIAQTKAYVRYQRDLYPGIRSKVQINHRHQGAVVSNGMECSRVGRDIFRQNGSVVDAAIATQLCESVACPQSLGLGGGFVATIYIKSTGRAETLNAREVAPKFSDADMFSNRTVVDGVESIAIPSSIKGYWMMHQKYGRLPWEALFGPAIELCHNGTVVNSFLSHVLEVHQKVFESYPELGQMFLDPSTGHGWKEGDRIRRPQLAETLKILAREGVDSMYRADGTILKMMLEDLSDAGSILTEDDFVQYEARWTEPESYTIRSNLTMYTSALPATGFLVPFILKVLDSFALGDSALSYHRIVEVFKYAFAGRTKMGDPMFETGIQEIINEMMSDQNVDNVRNSISDDRTFNDYHHYGAIYTTPEDHGTAHTNILAPNGDAISITSSLNNYFGCKVSSTQTGIIFNSQMDDFSNIGVTNLVGLLGSPANRIRPWKQPISSVSPTIIVDTENNVRLVIGAAGGTKITTAMAFVLLRHLYLNESLTMAMAAPRIHHQLMPMQLHFEPELDAVVQLALLTKGHRMTTSAFAGGFGSINAIQRDRLGRVEAFNDPRRVGSMEVFDGV